MRALIGQTEFIIISIKHEHYVMDYFVPLWSFLFYKRNKRKLFLVHCIASVRTSLHFSRALKNFCVLIELHNALGAFFISLVKMLSMRFQDI